MIIGLGTDVLEIHRITSILSSSARDQFVNQILTGEEQKLLKTRMGRAAEFIAGRFAAKEAVAKAFGCGIGELLNFQDIQILSGSSGEPTCKISLEALKRLNYNGPLTVHLSITHSETVAFACAVVEQRSQT